MKLAIIPVIIINLYFVKLILMISNSIGKNIIGKKCHRNPEISIQ
jgi:hypothetical protein